MGRDPDKKLTRRSFLTRFREILADSVAAAAEGVGKASREATRSPQGTRARGSVPSALDFHMPERGMILDGIPVVHPWIGIASALVENMSRGYPHSLLLGGSGEAFRVVYSREQPEEALRHSPVNTFLASLALCGLTGKVAFGGPFEPALGGVEVTLDTGAMVVAGLRSGPGILAAVDRRKDEADWIPALGKPVKLTLPDLMDEWAEGWWEAGEQPYLRIAVEEGRAPRPFADVARVGLETMTRTLTQAGDESLVTGLAAYAAFAADLRENRIEGEAVEPICGEFLIRTAVSRIGAWRFLEAIARTTPPEHREHVEAAAMLYREIHNPDPTGDLISTGLFPEVAECLLTEEKPDPEKLADEAIRERAAGLLEDIRKNEEEAVEQILELPKELRTLC